MMERTNIIYDHHHGDCAVAGAAGGAQSTLYSADAVREVWEGRAGPKLVKQIGSMSDIRLSSAAPLRSSLLHSRQEGR